MSSTGVVFGERVVLLEDAVEPLPARVFLPGPGVTVAERVERAVDPVAEKQRVKAAADMGLQLRDQCEVDIAAADRLCPPTTHEYRWAQAVLDLGLWRYQLDRCPPGPRLAALLEQRPTDASPTLGAGEVVGGTITLAVQRAPGGPNRGADAAGTGARPGDASDGDGGAGADGAIADAGSGCDPRAGDGGRSTTVSAEPSGGATAVGGRRADPALRVISTDPERAPAPLESDIWPRTVLATIQARQRLISHLQAQQYADIAELSATYRDIQQFLTSELGLALTLTDSDAAALLATAEALRDRLPGTATALAEGRIDDAKATAMVRATANCTPDVAEQVERSVLPDAERTTVIGVCRLARRAVIAADPDGAADRHRRAVSERHVWRAPDQDGMARLGIYASAQDVDTIWRAITATADAIKQPDDARSLGERRADAMVLICSDILGAGGWDALRLPDKGLARPRVNVTVPYTVLLGHRAPGELAGNGPICTEQALALIGGGDLYRMICDPESGMLLDYGHTRYRPPPHLAEFVRLRDGECPLPTCHHPAERGQVDHVVPAKPDPVTGKPTLGTTSAANLGPPCPHHHLAKDADRGFTLHRAKDGTYTWTTPLGLVYRWRPDPLWHDGTDAIPESVLREVRQVAPGEVRDSPDHPVLDRARSIDEENGGSAVDCDGAAGGDRTSDDEQWDAPVCDCADSCPCQQPPSGAGADAPKPLTVDGDWADGFARSDARPAPPLPQNSPVGPDDAPEGGPDPHPADDPPPF